MRSPEPNFKQERTEYEENELLEGCPGEANSGSGGSLG